MGSANINDRSMLGCRDTEVAVHIEDTDHIVSFMNGVPYAVGKTPHEFRKQLMSIHLGSSSGDDIGRCVQCVDCMNWVWLLCVTHDCCRHVRPGSSSILS